LRKEGFRLSGAQLMLLYALGPAKQSLCGSNSSSLKDNIGGIVNLVHAGILPEKEAEIIASKLKNATRRCRALAELLGINDPFSSEVVRTYFIGSKQLFKLPKGFEFHHNFGVLGQGTKGNRARLCLIRAGRIRRKNGEVISVNCRTIRWNKDNKVSFGKIFKFSVGIPRELNQRIKIGDWVSFHWGWICQTISEEQKNILEAFTARIFDHYNQNS